MKLLGRRRKQKTQAEKFSEISADAESRAKPFNINPIIYEFPPLTYFGIEIIFICYLQCSIARFNYKFISQKQ